MPRLAVGVGNLVPPYVTGFAERSPTNLATTIAVIGSIAREKKIALRFPRSRAGWTTLGHFADADVVAQAAIWSATSKAANNEMFNVTNGDPSRWCHLSPEIAQYFDVASADPLPAPLADLAPWLGEAWKTMASRDSLKQADLNAMVD